MWILTPLQSGDETLYLLPGKEYTVGRKNCDILLPNDQSISRSHAKLTITDQTVTLKDTSKYGTFVNNQQLTAAPVDLVPGDNVTFGVFHSKFSVLCEKPVVCSSCLDNAGKSSLSQALLSVGGKLVNTWTQDCTHLVMPSVKVTVKTISALLCCRPIVKPEFFSELSNAAQQKLPLPKAESFIPDIDEPSLNKEDVDLRNIPARNQLFSGKTFVFLSAKQLKRLSAAVSFGGGMSRLLEEGSLPRDLLESPHSCVVDVTVGSFEPLLPPSSTDWANSLRSIIQRKGRRVIPESEIGLAAIYASCDKYCNPSCPMTGSDVVPKVKPRIPSASLSQNVAVDETVLAAASQNVTAYAANTEQSQRTGVCEMTGVAAVGETPEKNQVHHRSQTRGPGNTPTTQSMVAEAASSSFSAAGNKNSQKKKLNSKVTDGGSEDSRPPSSSASKTNSGTKMFPYKPSPQKTRPFSQASPQKQSTLISFLQPVKKKRPLEDEPSAVVSEPKRPAPELSIALPTSDPIALNQTPSFSPTGPPAASQSPADSSDLFVGRSESRKRKEIEADIQMEELESIMSEAMGTFDDGPSGSQEQLQSPAACNLAKQTQDTQTRKRQRVDPEGTETSKQKQQTSLGSGASFQKNDRQRSEQRLVSVKTEQVHPTDQRTPDLEPKNLLEVSCASMSKNISSLEDDDSSFIEDEELLQVDICQSEDETAAFLKPVTVKQEVQESKLDEELPQKLVAVEFRCLTVTSRPKTKPRQMQGNGNVKNFKCFRKKTVPGAGGFPTVIRGSDLFVHNKGSNCDLDEWMKDAAEEERQNRRDETVGDDLFRYNPIKSTKRR